VFYKISVLQKSVKKNDLKKRFTKLCLFFYGNYVQRNMGFAWKIQWGNKAKM